MSTYEQAERARDIIADRLLDGISVISVGLTSNGRVGVTATRPVILPPLPKDLQDVPIDVVLTSERGEVYDRRAVH